MPNVVDELICTLEFEDGSLVRASGPKMNIQSPAAMPVSRAWLRRDRALFLLGGLALGMAAAEALRAVLGG